MTTLQPGYEKVTLNQTFATMKGFYILFRPFMVPYDKIASHVESSLDFGMIECAPLFGNGWIGLPVNSPQDTDLETKTVQGVFISYTHVGPYKGLGQAYKKIMKDYPKSKDFYNVYVSEPDKTPAEELITKILFRA